MDFLLFLATFVLFFVLTPGVVLSLPPKGSKLVTALVHALLFAILLTLFMECFKTDDKEGIMLMASSYPKAYDNRDRWGDKKQRRIKGTSLGDEYSGSAADSVGSSQQLMARDTRKEGSQQQLIMDKNKVGHDYNGIIL